MARIDTVDKLTARIDRELSWRKMELINLRSLVDQNQSNKHIIRAAFPLICAHYEGFLKKAAALYLQHISDLMIPLIDLKHAFAPMSLSAEFTECKDSKRGTVRARVIAGYNTALQTPLIVSNPSAFIDTESNPKPDVLKEILESLAIDSTPFHTKFTFINDSLLKNRHDIVHGEYCDIPYTEFQDVLSTTLDIIENIKNILLDSAINAHYRK